MSHDPRFLAKKDQSTIIPIDDSNLKRFDRVAISKVNAR
jgi:hypothetical protein